MSRSGLSYDWGYEFNNQIWLYEQARINAYKGKRGQKLLRLLLESLDNLPEKRLAGEALVIKEGDFCSIGAVANNQGLDVSDLSKLDDEAAIRKLSNLLNAPAVLIRDIIYENDSWGDYDDCETDEERLSMDAKRWVYMRVWVDSQIQNGGES